ncbi:MAG: DUF3078 domain-containing protein [Rikenellaceae bacterium]|nr:DUF3078 domain-containing protein [Rikenellaceae bacterium]
MNRRILLIALLLVAGIRAGAQTPDAQTAKDTSYWKLTGITGLNFSQAALVNWSAGGENSMALNVYLNGSLNYARDKWAWDNTLVLEFGETYAEEYDWRKNADKIAFTSKLGYQINKKWYYSLLGDFNSQFAKGYKYPNTDRYISTFMAPAYANVAFGIDYKPNDRFSLFMSPATAHGLFVRDDSLSRAGAFGITPGDRFRLDAGAMAKATLKQTIMTNVDLISALDLFTPYNRGLGNVDVNWEMLFSFKINKALTATLSTTLRYYDKEHFIDGDGMEKGPRIQFKELLGLGVAYRF